MPARPSATRSRRPLASGQSQDFRAHKAASSSTKRANILGTRPPPQPASVPNPDPVPTPASLSPTLPTTRLCVKNLPSTFTPDDIHRHFSTLPNTHLTDVQLMRTPDGRSRRFAFLGLRTAEEAAAVQRYFDRNFLGTARISVQFALEKGNAQLQRPWSKYSEGSSRAQAPSEEAKEQRPAEGRGGGKGRATGLDGLLESVVSAEKAEALKKDPLFHDYLQVMGGVGRGKFWENDEGQAAERGGGEEEREERKRLLGALDDGEGSDEDTFDPAEERKDGAHPKGDGAVATSTVDDAAADEEDEDEEAEEAEEGKEGRGEGEEERGGAAADATGEVDDTRLFIRNLPFDISEEELTSAFASFGPIQAVHVPVTASGQGKGFAFLSFFNASHARAALSMSGHFLLGRIVHVLPSFARPAPPTPSASLSYKAQKEASRKQDAANPSSWNALFLRPDTVMSSMADQLGVAKADILDVSADASLAVRLALAETHLIGETKRWLAEQGVNVTALERVAGEEGRKADVKRSKRVILVKNVPYDSDVAELRTTFAQHGALRRVVMPPSKAMALVEFEVEAEAKKAFMALAYSKYHHVPLYLEWAPSDTLPHLPPPPAPAAAEKATEAGEGEVGEGGTIFVKNLNFSTTEAALLAAFTPHAAVRSVHIATKKNSAAAIAAGKPRALSMGYGFVELRRPSDLPRVLRAMQGAQLDSHALELKPSTRVLTAPSATSSSSSTATTDGDSAIPSRRVIVKNLPFEATAAELKAVLGAFGTVGRVRLPKKADGGHRGFAFVDFVSRREAKTAVDAVGATHLYGRPLVLEWSDEKEEGAEEGEALDAGEERVRKQREKTKRQFDLSQAPLPPHKRRRKERSADEAEEHFD